MNEDLLRNTRLLGAIATFIDEQRQQRDDAGECANLLACWLALDAALALPSDAVELRRAAHASLVRRFVEPAAPNAVRAFDVDVQAALLSTAASPPGTAVLRRAQANVFRWLQKQLFTEFERSPLYRRLRFELDELAANQIAATVVRVELCEEPTAATVAPSDASVARYSAAVQSGAPLVVVSASGTLAVYVIQCRGQIASWLLFRRYSELREFDRQLRLLLPHERELAGAVFPKKKTFGALSEAFLRKRLELLRAYIDKLLRIDAVLKTAVFRDFFHCDWHARHPALVPAQLAKIRADATRAVNSLEAPAAVQAAQRALELAAGDAIVAVAAAHAYALAGHHMRSLEWLHAALAAGYANFANLKHDTAFQLLRRLPQFAALLALYPERDAAALVSPRSPSAAAADELSAQAAAARRTPTKRPLGADAAAGGGGEMLAGDGWGSLTVELVIGGVLEWLTPDDLGHAALVCRRWQLLCYVARLWRCVALTAPRTVEGRVRPRLRRRFFGKAVRGILIGSYPVAYTDKLAFLEAMFGEFNIEAMSAVYASYNGSMRRTISYLQAHSTAPKSFDLARSMPPTISEPRPQAASPTLHGRRGTRDWRHELKERAEAFDEQSKLLLGAAPAVGAADAAAGAGEPQLSESGALANVSYFIARPVTSVYTLSANGYLAYELAHNPLLLALQRTEFVDLVNILVEENCLLVVPQESTVRQLVISRHFIQHHVVILDNARSAAPSPRRRRRLYSGPREIELLNMLLAGDEETVTAAPAAAPATPAEPLKSPFAASDDDAGDDDDSDSVDASRAEADRALGLSTLSGARGTINTLRTSLRLATDVDNRSGGEKHYQTVRFLREGKVSIGGSVLLHIVVVSAPLQRYGEPWQTLPDAPLPSASPATATPTTVTAAATSTSSAASADAAVPSRAFSATQLETVRSALVKPIEQLVRRTKNKRPTSGPLPTYEASDDGGAIGSSISVALERASDDGAADLGIIGNAAWRELPMLVRKQMQGAPPHQVNLMTSWAQSQFFAPLCRQLMDANKEAVDKDAFFAAQVKRLSFVTMEHLGIATAYRDDELFQTAIDELAAINDVTNPNEKLACILNCCRVLIYQLQSSGSAASADDFLPHVIWVVLKGNIDRLHGNCAFIRDFCSPDALRMEAQYFFTNIEICTSFIENIEPSYLKISEEEFDRLYNSGRRNKSTFGRMKGFFGAE